MEQQDASKALTGSEGSDDITSHSNDNAQKTISEMLSKRCGGTSTPPEGTASATASACCLAVTELPPTRNGGGGVSGSKTSRPRAANALTQQAATAGTCPSPVSQDHRTPASPHDGKEDDFDEHSATPLNQHPKYACYFKMLKVGHSPGAVLHKMRREGFDPAILDCDPTKPLPKLTAKPPEDCPAAPRLELPRHPSSNRKKLHWEVRRQSSRNTNRKSIWNLAVSKDPVAHVRMSQESKDELKRLFMKATSEYAAVVMTGAGNGKGGTASKKKQAMHLVDLKKAQNIAIALARVKLPISELKRELLTLNPTVLLTPQLQSLMDMWPDRQEQIAIDNFDGAASALGAADRFLVETRDVPRFRDMLGCLIFKQEFPKRVHELCESMNLVIRGVNQVCCSSALRQVFHYILQTGNFLNFGGEDERALAISGFSLDSLDKLSQTKAFTSGTTVLRHIVHSIERDIPKLGQFPQEINLIHKCSRVSISAMFAEMRGLEDGLRSLTHEAHAVAPAEGDADAELGASILNHFAAEVGRELDALQSLLDQLSECKSRFLEYFEEEDSSEELDVLLTHIAKFTTAFEREHSALVEAREREERQEKHQQQQEHAKASKPHHTQPHKNSPQSPPSSQHSNQQGHALTSVLSSGTQQPTYAQHNTSSV